MLIFSLFLAQVALAQFTGDYKIINKKSGKAVSVVDGLSSNGANIHQWDFNNAPEQVWNLTSVGNGNYVIYGKPSGKVLNVAAGSTAEGANVELNTANGSQAQNWKITELANGYYSLVNVHSNKALSVANSSISNGGNIDQESYTGGENQQWGIVTVGNTGDIQGPINRYSNLNAPRTEPMIPKWAFGYWQSFWGDEAAGYGHQASFIDHAKALRGIDNQYGNHKHPADVMVLDMYWNDINWGWPGNMNWSYTRFPNPQEMFDTLHNMNFRISLNYHSGGFGTEWLNKMREHLQWGADVPWLDFWDAGSSYESQVWNLLQEVNGPNKRNLMFTRHYARPNKHNYESNPWGNMGNDKVPNEDAIQKTMPMQWTGDNDGTWDGLQEAIEGIVYGSDGAMDGWSYLHADCPGHMKGTDPELANRWIQFSDFSPITRNHGTTPRDVWSWGPHVEANSKFSRELRYRLLPYIYTYSWKVYENAIPLTRPLRLVFPGQRDDIRYSYMFGDELLVAPVYKPLSQMPSQTMSVFLPSGHQWIDFWTNEVFNGGQTIQADVSAANDIHIPLYVKRGAIIPMGPQIYFIDPAIHPNPLTLNVYPLENGQSSFTMYDDDGESNAYKNGSRTLTTFTSNVQSGSTLTFSVGADIGSYAGKPTSRTYIIKINLQTTMAQMVSLNGVPLNGTSPAALLADSSIVGWAYDNVAKICYVQFSSSTSNASTVILNYSSIPTFTLSASGTNGSVTMNPPGGIYTEGTLVSLSAEPAPGYIFNSWSGALSGSSSPATITMNSNKSVSANFSVNPNIINLPGRVEAENYKSGGEGIGYHDLTIGNSGGAYKPNDNVDIQICTDVGAGYNVGWTSEGEWLAYDVNVPTTGIYKFTARMASASAGTKSITVSVDNTTVGTFNFTDASGWQSWKDVIISNINLAAGFHVLKFTMNTPGINLNYVDVTSSTSYSLTTSTSPTNGGSVTGAGSYSAGSIATVTALPNKGYTFSGWSGALNGTTSPASITINGNTSVTAHFSPIPSYTLNITGANGTVSANPPGPAYDSGTVVTLTASANSGFSFNGWSGDLTGSTNPALVTMNTTKNISATFGAIGNAIALPGRIEAENYKAGGAGVGYNDLTAGNSGGAYKPNDNVDIENCSDVGAGYNIGWTSAGEWLAYDVNVATSGNYQLIARLASAVAGTKTLTVSVDNVTVATFNFTDASGWQSWKNVVIPSVYLTAGIHSVKLTMTTGGFNINYVDVTSITSYTLNTSGINGTVVLSPAGGTYASGTLVTLTAVANSGYTFNNWSGALSGSTNPSVITMDNNKSVTANFKVGSTCPVCDPNLQGNNTSQVNSIVLINGNAYRVIAPWGACNASNTWAYTPSSCP